ncbi:MAG: 16S rRNA (cytosine(1402)-N(4))-methyltransferase [Spirochaetes bacterium GWD1_61_31]|nr:MAG: 16S rRNA (cytosine(1402)-N(4))-methyltransferase [Spirochaetes bacterium GWB1_60_80]OHD34721.1 MAG: 16S rRNA (cytosine(1402)-N(4))-methyltransferase [Spirochaetes bacterium GWC1_61_12]OHD38745.1 MAG: 16S rRNA (cytosine(1402)-N(4))-methyltransferase [Spirochaetes bacterium GWD1_61_31]OHD59360.1 MAG: 16S rRNA (cytosine(1402)-N(4))-methyltransferase [Spirochaetes bacterium GWF1_60_12]HAP43140.1 16S rRNA (cytosine(1402)-N(4))-methyltransferase [Spirochaetaceae bacterium]
MDGYHVSVMLDEVLAMLNTTKEQPLLVDATLGLAGHAIAFLEKYPGLRLVGVDADQEVQAIARARLDPYGDRVRLFHAYYDDFFKEFAATGERPDLILFDLGMSMYHFRNARRGFSLQSDDELDMRLDPQTGRSALQLLEQVDEAELRRILQQYGEEPQAGRIAAAIVRQRQSAPVRTASQLAELVRRAVPANQRYGRVHPATRSFQAIRIAVNDELGRIERVLPLAVDCLAPGGVMGVISFHSLEDRLVKRFFRERTVHLERDKFKPAGVAPISTIDGLRALYPVNRKPLEAGAVEVAANPASRSAKLRVARVSPAASLLEAKQ